MNPDVPTSLAIGLDVGGTKIAGGVVTSDGEIVDRLVVLTPTETDPSATLDAIERVIKDLRGRHPGVKAIGVGAAGMVEWPSGHIRFAPHNAYRDLPLRQYLHEATGLPTVVDNDANVAMWAEVCFGAAAGRTHAITLTVGTGIGGGLYLGGQIYRGATGLGSEVGHLIVDPNGLLCPCGSRGCLETRASGTALGRLGCEAARAEPDGLLATLAGQPELVTGEIVFKAALQDDKTALSLFSQIGFWLGVGVASLVTLFDPEVVVIGGGLVEAGELLLGPAHANLERYVFGRQHRILPPLVPARLGPDAGLVGAAALALHVK